MTQIDLEPLIQRAEIDAGRFFATLRQMEQALVQTGRASDTATRNVASNFRGLGTAFRSPLAAITSFRTAIVGLSAAFGVTAVVRYADSFRTIQNSLRVAGVETENMAAATSQLFDTAIRARVPVQALAEMYQRTAVAGAEFGITQDELARSSELAAMSVAVAGSSTAAADGALRQYGQAVGSARVELEEFRSIQDGALPILQAVARGMLEAGGSVNKLRELIKNGQVSGEGFFRAFMAGSEGIEEAFAKTESTVAQAFTNLNTATTELIGGMDQSSGGSKRLAGAINDLAKAMSDPVFQEFARNFAAGMAENAAQFIKDATETIQVINELNTAASDFDLGAKAADDAQRIQEIRAEIAKLVNDLAALPASAQTDEMVQGTVKQIATLRDEEVQLQKNVDLYRERAAAAPIAAAAAVGTPEQDLRLLQSQALAGGGSGGVDLLKPVSTKDFPVSGGDKTKKATFEDIIGPLRTRLELLQQTELTEDRISEIIAAQGRLKRDLTTVEREALNSINAQVDAEEEIREKAEERKDAGEDLVESADEQLAKAQLLIQFGGQETTEYQRQLALLEAQQEVSGALTAEERRRVLVAQEATQEAEKQVRMLELQQRTQQAEFGARQAPEAAMSEITGLPPRREFFAQQERFRLQQEGRSAFEVASMEPLIQDLARAQQHMQLLTDTAPKLAHTLTEIGQIAIADGFEEAGEQFLAMLSEMIFEAILLQTIMAAIGMFAPNPIKPMATTPGGTPIYGLQHGGRARKGEPVIVGEAGPELFVPDAAGQVHSTPDTTAMMGGGGGGRGAQAGGGAQVQVRLQTPIYITNNTDSKVEAKETQEGEEGGGRIDIMIDEMVAGNMRPGTATSRAMQARFGLKYQTRS